jgi:uncharacterized phage protein (TIGR02218 family)
MATFIERETSTQDGRPAYLIKFFRTGKAWTYTNTEQVITMAAEVYTPIPFSISAIVQTGDAKAESLDVTIPSSCELGQYLEQFAPSSPIYVTLRRLHMEEAGADFTPPALLTDAPVTWAGELVSTSRPVLGAKILRCNTLSLSLTRGGLRLTWQRPCTHALYGRGCLVDKSLFAVPLSAITVVNGSTIEAAELALHPSGYFSGGFIEWFSEPGVQERIGIEGHSLNSALLYGSTNRMNLGSGFVAYPGCDRTAAQCESRYSNILNYGGVNHLQGRNPFDGNPVF